MFKITLSGTRNGIETMYELPWDIGTLAGAKDLGRIMALGAPFNVKSIVVRDLDGCQHSVLFIEGDRRVKVTLVGGQVIMAHDPKDCVGEVCCVHNPSDHHMVTWPQYWRSDRRIMERICEHGCGHPDPDGLTTDRAHGCDGCCNEETLWNEAVYQLEEEIK